jgi:adenine-specific DNA-methyltransferase
VREQHFLAHTPATKTKYHEQDAKLRAEIAELLRSDGWDLATARKLALWDPYDQNASAEYFDTEWMFGETEGFDVVIGNPPYVRHETISDFREQIAHQYETAASRADLFVFFFERAVRLLKSGGVFCYISSNKYFRAAYGANLRRYLTDKTVIEQIVDFGDAPVFTAIAYASIFIANRGKPQKDHCVWTLTWVGEDGFGEIRKRITEFGSEVPQAALKPEGWSFSAGNSALVEKLKAAGTPLKEYVRGRCCYGIKTGLNDAFVIDGETRKPLLADDPKSKDLIKPWLRGRDVKRWRVDWAGLYAIVFPFGFHTRLAEYPSILRHLTQFEAELRKRGQCVSSRSGTGKGQHHWLELDNNPKPTYLAEFTIPKVIIPAIERGCAFAFDGDGYYSNDKTTICVSNEARFLCAMLNSSVVWWVIRQVAAERQNSYYEFKPMYVNALPIPASTPADRNKLTALVDRILKAKQVDAAADTSPWEREIDERVYRLYGLTPDEIRLVEESAPSSGRRAEPTPESPPFT